jgi:hypothetical protein
MWAYENQTYLTACPAQLDLNAPGTASSNNLKQPIGEYSEQLGNRLFSWRLLDFLYWFLVKIWYINISQDAIQRVVKPRVKPGLFVFITQLVSKKAYYAFLRASRVGGNIITCFSTKNFDGWRYRLNLKWGAHWIVEYIISSWQTQGSISSGPHKNFKGGPPGNWTQNLRLVRTQFTIQWAAHTKLINRYRRAFQSSFCGKHKP